MASTLEDLQSRFPDRTAIDPDEAGKILDMHPAHVRRLLRAGALPGTHIGSRWCIPLTKLAAVLDGEADVDKR